MDRPEDWHQIETIFHRVVELNPDSRESFLDKACGQNTDLRREVESLLAHHNQPGLLAQPAKQAAAQMVSGIQASWRLASGTRLGPYEIIASIGAGGMAEVYRARDSKLHRDVAIKVLPEAFAQDRERVARFHREAQLLASLNHPRIAAIYGLEESDGLCGLALEFIEGETLAERIAQDRLSVKEALELACQIAEALEAAHSKAVVHRDLKPANIKVTREGKVKVLDFGLAKIFESGISPSDKVTRGIASTEDNIILGTVGYMSPEQARGKDVDKRTDIWAWGCVLYEMLTSRRTFDGDSTTDVIAKIVSEEPDWTRLPQDTPLLIRTLLRRALQKDPNRRLHDIADARIEIEELPNAAAALIQQPRQTRDRWSWLVAAIALVVAAASLATTYWRSAVPRETAVVRFTIPPPPKKVFQRAGIPEIALSPDGRYLAFRVEDEPVSKLWVRAIDSANARLLPGTDGAIGPSWSSDSKFIGFTADGKFKKIVIGGGPPETISNVPCNYGTWNRDGLILCSSFSENKGIFSVSAAERDPAPVTSLNPHETRHIFPFFMPDDRHFLYLVVSAEDEVHGIYVGSLDSTDRKRVVKVNTRTIYSEGHLLWVPEKTNTLMAQAFDDVRLETRGEPFVVAEEVGQNGWLPSISTSRTGILAYGGPEAARGAQLAWFDRSGRSLGTIGEPDFHYGVRLSPDGKRAVFERFDPRIGTFDLWLAQLSSGILSRFTFGPSSASATHPVWSYDGNEIAFASNRTGANHLYRRTIGGSEETSLFEGSGSETIDDWSSDGRYVIFTVPGDQSVWALPLFGDRKPLPLLHSPFPKSQFNLSHDVHWIAYNSDESGSTQVYVAAFPSMTARRQVSNAGGGIPRWRRDGKEIFYLAPDGKLMAVAVKTIGNTIETDIPTVLFQTRTDPNFSDSSDQYDVTPDGQRFLVLQPPAEPSSVPPITVVVNWLAAIQKK